MNEFDSVVEAIEAGWELDDILQLIVTNSQVLLDLQHVYIVLYEAEQLWLKANTNDLPTRVLAPTSAEARVVAMGRAVALEPIQALPLWRTLEFAIKTDTRGWISAPIRLNGHTVGALAAFAEPTPEEPLREALRFMTVLADLAALALERGQFWLRHQRRSQFIALLRTISSLSQQQPLGDLAHTIAQQLCKIGNADLALMYIPSPETEEFVTLGLSDTPLALQIRELGLDHIPLASNALLHECYQTGQAQRLALTNEQWPELAQLGVQQLLIVPIHDTHERLGVIVLASLQDTRFDDDALNFLNFIGVRLGYALKNENLLEEVVQAERRRINEDERSNFIASVAHDLKNALTTVIGTTQLGMRKLRRGDQSYNEKALTTIATKSQQALQLIEDMVDVSRLEQGTFRLFIQSIDLVQLVADEAEAARVLSQRHTIQFASSLEHYELAADQQRLRQVLANLLINAIRYSPDGGTISVRIMDADHAPVPSNASISSESELDQAVVISVSDQGIGIPEHELPYIFERFYRGQGSTVASGSGLGLYISAAIMAQHGGKMWVESKLNHGTTFYCSLPAARVL
ncbi:MAG: GAF domain-containing protein [Chloroflexi bacterium]|nr:GAF domain-containing protein [Chloroflexota bacterium]